MNLWNAIVYGLKTWENWQILVLKFINLKDYM